MAGDESTKQVEVRYVYVNVSCNCHVDAGPLKREIAKLRKENQELRSRLISSERKRYGRLRP